MSVSLSFHLQHFIHNLSWVNVPANVQRIAVRCVIDLVAALVAGRTTQLGHIVHNVAAQMYGGDDSTLLLDGRRVSVAGAALANGMTIDAMDIHDGYRPAKGHAGASIFPAALAIGEYVGWSGVAFMTGLVIGYEIALRAAMALHRTSCDYHTSGAWGALGASAVTARALGLDAEQTAHALGIAEYHGPRSQMMRCIDHPTMLKDGSGWGSMAGVIAGQLAGQGFSGAPALLVQDGAVADLWSDLGERWLIRDLYFKPHACCRWAQPAVEGARALVTGHHLTLTAIQRIVVATFAAATRLTISRPTNTEESQYSLPYPVAAAIVFGRVDPVHVMAPSIYDERVLRLADCVEMVVDDALEQRFPDETLARVAVEMADGRVFESGICSAYGDPHTPLNDSEINDKFFRLTGASLTTERAEALHMMCGKLAEVDHVEQLVALLSAPPDKSLPDGE